MKHNSKINKKFLLDNEIEEYMKDIREKQIYKLKFEISELIRNDNGSYVSFEYNSSPTFSRWLDVITYNPRHGQHFLFGRFYMKDLSELEVLEKVRSYIKKPSVRFQYTTNKSYSIKWWNKEQSKLITSSFYGEDIYDVLYKFYCKKKKDSIEIHEISLNPQS